MELFLTNLKYIISGVVIACILFVSGLLVGRYNFAKPEIKVVEKIVTKTEWKTQIKYIDNQPLFDKENFDRLLGCYSSNLQLIDKTENDWLLITAKDDCKEVTGKYRIGQSGNMNLYIGIGIAGIITGGVIAYMLTK